VLYAKENGRIWLLFERQNWAAAHGQH